MIEGEALYAWFAILAPREGRGHNGRHAKSQQCFAGNQVWINCVRGGSTGRRNMIEESSPLIVVDNKKSLGPARPIGYCMKGLGQKCIAGANVGMRMIVISGAIVGCGESRIEK